MTERITAKDMMMEHIKAALPVGVVALWPDTPQSIPDGEPWVRPTIRHAGGKQASLAGVNGQRKFKHYGILIVQIFTPGGDGQTKSDTITQAFLTYFEKVNSSPIWYRNIRAIEIGKDGAAEQVNFMADFQYDNIN
jgi:hypothetical protein